MGKNNRQNEDKKKDKLYKLILFFLPVPFFVLAFYKSMAAVTVHGFTWHLYVPFISAILIYNQKSKLAVTAFRSNVRLGTIIIICAFLILFIGDATSTLLLSEISIVIALWGVVFLFGGLKLFLILSGPLLYLLFISSVTEGVFDLLTPSFRQLSALIATMIAKLMGYSVLLSDTYIRLPSMVLNVANECSGVNHFISLFAISLPMAFIAHSMIFPRLLMVISSLPVALVSNSIRVLIIIMFNYNRVEFTHGPKNLLVTGSGFFIGIVILLLISTLLKYFFKKSNVSVKENDNLNANQLHSQGTEKRIAFLSALLLLISLVNVFWKVKDDYAIPITIAIDNDGLKSELVSHIPGLDSLPAADKEQRLRITDSDNRDFYLYSGWYSRQLQNREAAGYLYDRILSFKKTCKIGNNLKFRMCTSENSLYSYLTIYRSRYWYTSSPVVSKFFSMIDAFLNRTTSASIVIIALLNDKMENVEYLRKTVGIVIPAIEASFNK